VSASPVAALDHLVVMASSLAEGVAWCEATLGVTPGPGGEHPLMGTHNRLLSVASPAFPRAYLEIIAIHPGANKSIPESDRRWFDMDFSPLQQHIATHGPQLIHWVARVPDLPTAALALSGQGWDVGRVASASRATPRGLLQWHISIRPDGRRLRGGCVPTLIQWGDTHPADGLPPCGVALQALSLGHPEPVAVASALHRLGLPTLPVEATPAPLLHATLSTPKGLRHLTSAGVPVNTAPGT